MALRRPASGAPAGESAVASSAPAFAEPLHVGRPNVGSRERFFELTTQALDRHWLTNDGPLVQELESAVASHLGVRHCVTATNGTLALELTIRALGLSGEVIVPSYTFVATAHAVHWQGITPVFADIDPRTHNLDPESVRSLVTPRTTGIIGVHLWGRGADVAELQRVADEHGLQLMFDAAHAFSATHGGQMIGGFGRAEVLSFHATKFFNTFEGGAVVTNDDGLAEQLRLMRNFGFVGPDHVVRAGTNAKLTEVCAAMGLANLENVDAIIDANRTAHLSYTKALAALPGLSVMGFDESERNNYQYVVLEVQEDCPVSRDDLLAALRAENVLARRYFWPGCHRMQPYRDLFPEAGRHLPHTEVVADRVIVMPTGPAVTPDKVDIIASILENRLRQA